MHPWAALVDLHLLRDGQVNVNSHGPAEIEEPNECIREFLIEVLLVVMPDGLCCLTELSDDQHEFREDIVFLFQ
jgi:hypothetical protein